MIDIALSREVAEAQAARGPVVALESTIITHGMPYPANVETALALEAAVRAEGATPATIAVLDGRLAAGLDAEDLDRLGRANDVAKASRRDLAPLVVRGATAGVTVAATMAIAARAGIEVFATGGIGGVHRGAEASFDVSADLVELGRTPVAVVSAGAKSILDIPKTLEALETQGVPVIGYRSAAFPAFFTPESGEAVDHVCDSPAEIAAVVDAHFALGGAGLLIANPIPAEAALEREAIEARIAEALGEAAALGVARKAVTPFLLRRVLELTEGRSLAANIALARNNAALAAQVAAALGRLRAGRRGAP